MADTQKPLSEEEVKSLQDELDDYAKAIESEFFLNKSLDNSPELDEEIAYKTKKVLISKAPELMRSAVELAVSQSVKDQVRAPMTRYLLDLLMSKRDVTPSNPNDPRSEAEILIDRLKGNSETPDS